MKTESQPDAEILHPVCAMGKGNAARALPMISGFKLYGHGAGASNAGFYALFSTSTDLAGMNDAFRVFFVKCISFLAVRGFGR